MKTRRLCSALAAVFLATSSVAATAQTRVVTLGTVGGPVLSLDRGQPANAVVVADRVYLVDAGNGVGRQPLAAGLDVRKVDNIFIPHNHDDHNADWGTIMGLAWSTGRRTDIHVWDQGVLSLCSAGFSNTSPRMPAFAWPMPRGFVGLRKMFKAHDIQGSGRVYKDDVVTVTAVENCHFHPDPAGGMRNDDKSYAYRFQTPDRVIVFSGDTGKCPAMTEFARGADILFHEVVDLPSIEQRLRQELPPVLAQGLYQHMVQDHTTAEDVGRLAQDAGFA